MTASEKRKKVCDTYSIILGRNIYSQDLRDYCYTPYKDGNYYSDCSSSISYAYKKAGFSFGILNTEDMYYNLETVPNIGIKNGIPVDTSLLRQGDMFLFAGNDASRPRCIGHVEMVYKINSDGSVILCGHGSDTPSTKDMVEYCTWRYNKWASGGWRKGLVCVKRFIQDDANLSGWHEDKYYLGNTGKPVTNDWYKVDSNWYYFDSNSNYVKDTWEQNKDKTKWYYLGSDGKMVTNSTINYKGYNYDLGNDGAWIQYTGWHEDRYYTGNNHLYVKNDWYKVDTDWYWFDDDGHKVCNTWTQDKNKKWYYLGNDGKMQKGGTVDWKGKTYTLNEDGSCKN